MVAIIKTICQMCNPAYAVCGMDVYIENGRIVKIKGMKNHPTNHGTLCAKGLASAQLEYDPRRLQYPLKRVGERGEGKWQRISWDEALDTIAAMLNIIKHRYGAEAVAYHRGQGPGWESNKDFVVRFMNVFGSPNFSSHAHLCHAPRRIAHEVTYGQMPIPDWENTKCMVLWGYNPVETSLVNHAARIIRAKERGARLIVIDPRFTKTASKADIWVQPRPGTDGALALSMANVIIKEDLYDKAFVQDWTTGFDKFAELVQNYPPERVEEITWVAAETIRQVAREFATNRPAALHECNGIDQHTNVSQTARALCILRAITGNLDVPGGSVLALEEGGRRRTKDLSLSDYSLGAIEKRWSRSVCPYFFQFKSLSARTSDVVQAIETGKPYPIRAMIVQGGDPLISLSNYSRNKEALKKLDFIAVHDLFMTRIAEIADVVLPAATFFERTLLMKFLVESRPTVSKGFLGLQNKVVEPLGEARSDADFIFGLARKMGFAREFPWESVEEAINEELEPLGLTVEDLKNRPEGMVREYEPQKIYRKYAEFCSGLPTKKVELYSKLFEQRGIDPLPIYQEPGESPISRPDLAKDYPFVCQATIKPGLFSHAQYRTLPWLKEIMPEAWAEINTETARELGIRDGDAVIVESPRGSIEIKAKVTEGIDPRVVSLTHGWGQAYAHGPIDNLITPDKDECPISGATGNRSFLCRLHRA